MTTHVHLVLRPRISGAISLFFVHLHGLSKGDFYCRCTWLRSTGLCGFRSRKCGTVLYQVLRLLVYYLISHLTTYLNNHHHHISFMELGHLLTRSGLTYPEVSSKVYHDSFCQLGSSISLPWVIYFEAFYLHVVSSFSCIPVICLKFVLFLTPLQFVHLFLICQSISLNMPVQRLKVAIPPLDLPCFGPVTHSGEILTTGKSHGKKPDRFF